MLLFCARKKCPGQAKYDNLDLIQKIGCNGGVI